MAKKPPEYSDRGSTGSPVPDVPAPPIAQSGRDGAEIAKEEVRSYLPNLARALLGLALADDAEATLHTRQQAIRQLLDIAGVVSPVPLPPHLHEHLVDGSGPN
jgi:hypothetical protein